MARGHKGGFVVLRFEFTEEDDGRWAAICKELGTATFGKSLEEARRDLVDAVELNLYMLEKHGERARFFKEHGIKIHREAPTSPPRPTIRNFSTLVEHQLRSLEYA